MIRTRTTSPGCSSGRARAAALLGAVAVAIGLGVEAQAQVGPPVPFTIMVESDEDRGSGSEVFFSEFASLADLVASTISSSGFTGLNVGAAFDIVGFAFDGARYHMLLESIEDAGANAEVFYLGYDSWDDVVSNVIAASGFSPLDVGNVSTIGGLAHDGSRFHLLVESDEDRAAGIEVILLSFDEMDNLLQGNDIDVSFTQLDLGAEFSIGGFTHDGSAYHLVLETDDDAAGGAELFRVQYPTLAELIAAGPAVAGFLQVNVGPAFSVGGVTAPEPGFALALAFGVLMVGASGRIREGRRAGRANLAPDRSTLRR